MNAVASAPVRLGDIVAAAGVLFGLSERTILGGARGSGDARLAIVWTLRMARGADYAPIADVFSLCRPQKAQELTLRARRQRDGDMRFRARTDLMFAAFVKTPKRG